MCLSSSVWSIISRSYLQSISNMTFCATRRLWQNKMIPVCDDAISAYSSEQADNKIMREQVIDCHQIFPVKSEILSWALFMSLLNERTHNWIWYQRRFFFALCAPRTWKNWFFRVWGHSRGFREASSVQGDLSRTLQHHRSNDPLCTIEMHRNCFQ